MKKLYYTCIDDDMPKDTFDKSSASFDKLTHDSTLSIVPVWDTKTGTVPSNTVPVIVPVIVPVSGTKTGTV